MATPEVRQTVIGDHNIFSATGSINIKYELAPAEARDRVPLTQLVESVKQFWIHGVLERSVHEASMLELRIEPATGAVEHPWARVLEVPGQPVSPLGAEQPIGAIFAQTGRALLILGEPGSGKTMTLLELARDLIQRFETDPTQAAPVVLNLSTWSNRRHSLPTWIEAELQNKYFVPARRTRAWLADSQLLLLLDGLDEVPADSRAACVRAINEFSQTAGVSGIAVCSRRNEYTALTERLRFTAAVCLQPLTPMQIDDYLGHAGPGLTSLRQVIHQDALLGQLASSPLMLSVITLAYQDLPQTVVAEQAGDTAESRRSHLFRTYVARMFQRGGTPPLEFPEARARLWLSWLASRMRDHSLSVFVLENLQPTWLATLRDRWDYALASRLASALAWTLLWWAMTIVLMDEVRPFLLEGTVFTLLGALVVGVVAGLVAGRRLTSPSVTSPWRTRLRLATGIIAHPVVLGLVFGAIGGVFFERLEQVLLGISPGPKAAHGRWLGLTTGLRYGVIFGLVFGFKGARSVDASDIRLSDKLTFSLAAARRGAWIGAVAGAIIGAILAVIALVIGWTDFVHKYRPLPMAAAGLSLIIIALVFGAVFALVGATFNMLASNDLPRGNRPGQGLKLAAQNTIVAGLVVGVFCTLPEGAYVTLTGQLHSIKPLAMTATAWALAAALWYGGLDVIQHVTLRTMLIRSGATPRRYAAFLDYATRLIILQKVGPGYIFVHRQLLEHFAKDAATAGGASGQEPQSQPETSVAERAVASAPIAGTVSATRVAASPATGDTLSARL